MQGYIFKVLKAISYIANALLDLETTKIKLSSIFRKPKWHPQYIHTMTR